jgi:cell division protein FtsB
MRTLNEMTARLSNWFAPLRGRVMVVFVLIVGLYFVLSFGEQAWRARDLEEDVTARQAEITELREQRAALEAQVQSFNTERYNIYVEQTARRDLNLAYPGETVMLVRWTPPPEAPVNEETHDEGDASAPNWQRWLEFLTRSDHL